MSLSLQLSQTPRVHTPHSPTPPVGYGNFPAADAIIDIDARNGRISSGNISDIVCVRSTPAYAWDQAAAVFTKFAANTVRRTNLGIMHENAGTNVVAYSLGDDGTSGVVGSGGVMPTGWALTSSPLATTVVGGQTIAGVPCVGFRVQGSPTSPGTWGVEWADDSVAYTAANGQIWAGSAFVMMESYRRPMGDVGLQLLEMTAAGAVVATRTLGGRDAEGLTYRMSRLGARVTLAGGGTVARVRLRAVAAYQAGDVDFVVWLGLPQVETERISSPVETTGVAATRAADTITLSGHSYPRPFSQVVVWRNNDQLAGGSSYFLAATDGTNSNVMGVGWNNATTGAVQRWVNGGVITGGALQATGPGRRCVAAGFQSGSNALSVNGAAVATSTSGSYPSATLNVLAIGGLHGTASSYSFLERAIVITGRKTNSELALLSRLSNWGG